MQYKFKMFLESQPYYKHNINSGNVLMKSPSISTLKLDDHSMKQLCLKVESLYVIHIGDIPLEIRECKSTVDAVNIAKSNDAGKKVLRHLYQQSSIIAHVLSM